MEPLSGESGMVPACVDPVAGLLRFNGATLRREWNVEQIRLALIPFFTASMEPLSGESGMLRAGERDERQRFASMEPLSGESGMVL